jgi:hypothetical protein
LLAQASPLGLNEITLRGEPLGRQPFEHRVTGDELVIGRRPSRGLAIPNASVSYRQAQLCAAKTAGTPAAERVSLTH